MNTQSIWLNYRDEEPIISLNENMTVDVAVVGGGITGLSVLYQMRKTMFRACLLEKNLIGHETTARSTAKITYLQENNLTKIANIYDESTAYLYYKSQREAIRILKNIIEKEQIACDLQLVNSYLYTSSESEVKNIIKEKELLKKFKAPVKDATILPDEKHLYGIMVHNTYVFHPLKYLYELKRQLKHHFPIYEKSQVIKMEKHPDYYYLYVNDHIVKAKKVVICTHYPTFLFPYMMPLKCSLEKSYIGLFPDVSDNNYSAITNNKPITSIRYVEEEGTKYKLVLKGSHNICFKNNECTNFKPLIEARNPNYLWSNTDLITKDFMPLIGSIGKNLYLATGYNTWGMTNATIAGKLVVDLLMKKKNKYQKLFDPYRKENFKTLVKYPVNIASSLVAYANSKVKKNKNWYGSNIQFRKINGINVGVYVDEYGREHRVINRCPHMGCSLIFNDFEKTWDCPCHGSRFDIDGKCIMGPANYDIRY